MAHKPSSSQMMFLQASELLAGEAEHFAALAAQYRGSPSTKARRQSAGSRVAAAAGPDTPKRQRGRRRVVFVPPTVLICTHSSLHLLFSSSTNLKGEIARYLPSCLFFHHQHRNFDYRTPWTEEDVARFRDAVSTFGFVASRIHKHMGTHTLYDSPLVLFSLGPTCLASSSSSLRAHNERARACWLTD